jgi:hypothetical protein
MRKRFRLWFHFRIKAAIRLSVIKAVENIGDRGVVPALKTTAEVDSDEVVRNTAKVALTNLH